VNKYLCVKNLSFKDDDGFVTVTYTQGNYYYNPKGDHHMDAPTKFFLVSNEGFPIMLGQRHYEKYFSEAKLKTMWKCCECDFTHSDDDIVYEHLRTVHKYPHEDACLGTEKVLV
jgi:hypothetical protein